MTRHDSALAAPEWERGTHEERAPAIEWTWKAEGVSKVATLVVGGVLGLLVWRATGGNWTVVTLVVGFVLILLIVATHPAVLAAAVQLHRDARLAAVKERAIAEEARARRLEIAARKSTEIARLELQRAVDAHLLTARAGSQVEQIAVPERAVGPGIDRALLLDLLGRMYEQSNAAGELPRGILARRELMDAGLTQAQYEALTQALTEVGIAAYEHRAWRLNRDRFGDLRAAWRALRVYWESQGEEL